MIFKSLLNHIQMNESMKKEFQGDRWCNSVFWSYAIDKSNHTSKMGFVLQFNRFCLLEK